MPSVSPVIRKSGCGKSALLGRVFGVNPSLEIKVSSYKRLTLEHLCDLLSSEQDLDLAERFNDAVSPKIRGGLTCRENTKFILYTSSPDFLPNSDADFDEIRNFIQTRLSSEDPQQTLHAIWWVWWRSHGP